MKRSERKALIAALDTLITSSVGQLNELKREASCYPSVKDRLQLAKLATRIVMDTRRSLRFKAELLDGRVMRSVQRASGPSAEVDHAQRNSEPSAGS